MPLNSCILQVSFICAESKNHVVNWKNISILLKNDLLICMYEYVCISMCVVALGFHVSRDQLVMLCICSWKGRSGAMLGVYHRLVHIQIHLLVIV